MTTTLTRTIPTFAQGDQLEKLEYSADYWLDRLALAPRNTDFQDYYETALADLREYCTEIGIQDTR